MSDSDIKSSPRLAAYRGEARQILREKLKAEEALADIEKTEQLLADNYKTLSAPQVGALRAVLESKWRKVAKILPDLKAVEHEPGENAERLTRDQMQHELTVLHARVAERMHGRGTAADSVAVPGTGPTH
jgi:hypothetical protein